MRTTKTAHFPAFDHHAVLASGGLLAGITPYVVFAYLIIVDLVVPLVLLFLGPGDHDCEPIKHEHA
jgi:hypothetical protein